MRRKARPAPGFPAHLDTYDPGAWVDRYHWAMARWQYWQAHPQLHDVIDPVELLRQRREARLEAP